jgi:hypothetical protein
MKEPPLKEGEGKKYFKYRNNFLLKGQLIGHKSAAIPSYFS